VQTLSFCFQKDKQLQLRDVSFDILTSAEKIKDIREPELDCLHAFRDCHEFIEWVQQEVKGEKTETPC